MNVKLVAYTPDPELLCAKAMRSCRSKEGISSMVLPKEIKYYIDLAKKSGHVSVLEHASFTFSLEDISRVCSHQLVRHRIASYSQQSQRNVKPSDFVIPIRIQESDFLAEYLNKTRDVFEFYERMIDNGIPVEDARYILPNATSTNIVVTMNARELRHFFELRLHPSAQLEIRTLARKMLEEVKKVAPLIFSDIE